MKSIHISFEGIGPVELQKNLVRNYIRDIIISEGFRQGEISLIFCNDEYLLDVNRKYLSHDFFTDIITFNYTEDNIISGDLFISIDRVKENADQFIVSFNQELMRVVFHGILHMTGYDDKTEEEKVRMRKRENDYLEKYDLA